MSRYKWWIYGALSPWLHRGRSEAGRLDLLKVKRLLVVRPEKLGDVFVSLPLVDELRRCAPHAEISMLVSPRSYALVAADPRFAHVYVYHKSVWRDAPMVRRLRRERFDVVIDLVCNDTVTNLFLTQLAARGNPKFGMGKSQLAAYYDYNVPYRNDQWLHVIDRTLGVLSVFGMSAHPEAGYARPHVGVAARGKANEAAALLKRTLGTERLVGINVTAGEAMRLWPDDKWIALIRMIGESHRDTGLVVITPPEDRTRGERIAEACRGRVALVPPKLTIREVSGVIAHMVGLVTPDTVFVHIARSYHIPVVGLYTRFMENYHMWHPYRQREGIVLSPSSARIADIGVDEVYAAFVRLVSSEKVQSR